MISDRYKLLSMLGRGGMAQVWRGFDQRLDREVAIKILNARDEPGGCERFEREARTAAALTHANIVSLHDAGSDDGVDYLVMELVEGETLSHLIRRGPLPATEIAGIAGQICDALAAAHAAGIVHRDIKPGNVLITEAGQVKVCDFGIACHDNETPDATSDMAVGTAQYMAPEQARGGPATPRTDLYGLGCVLYAMATGQPPFTSKTSARVAWQHLNEPPVPLASRRPGTPSWLDSLVRSLLAKEPADRPASAAEVRALLPSPVKARPKAASVKAAMTTKAGKAGTVKGERAHRPVRTSSPAGEPTVHLAAPAGPIFAGRIQLATMGMLGFMALAAIVVVLSAISANDMPVARLGGPGVSQPPPEPVTVPAQAQEQVQAQPVSNPADALNALRTALDDERRAGNLEGRQLKELDGKLDAIERELTRGEDRKAAERLTDFAKVLAKLRSDGRIEAATLYTLQAALGDLAEQLPHAADED
jgi:serine/threonine-protein kinase